MNSKFSHQQIEDLKEEISNSQLANEGILGQDNVQYEKIEEVVDFEDWMVSENMPKGISFTLEANEWNERNLVLQRHPEILQTGEMPIFIARIHTHSHLQFFSLFTSNQY